MMELLHSDGNPNSKFICKCLDSHLFPRGIFCFILEHMDNGSMEQRRAASQGLVVLAARVLLTAASFWCLADDMRV